MKEALGVIEQLIPKEIRKSDRSKAKLAKILADPSLQTFIDEHPELPKETYQRSQVELDRLLQERSNCNNCPGLARCPNLISGHYTDILADHGYLNFKLYPCDKLLADQQRHHRQSLIRSHHIARAVSEATFETLDHDSDRVDAIDAAVDFCEQFVDGKIPTLGLYLYGPLGAGKSMIAGAIARDLIRYGVDSYMLYLPEFMREIKRSIQDGSVEEKINQIKEATVVIFDDIGAEVVTPWTRDEVLGAILQYRTNEQRPTIYTSNLALDELEEHLAIAQKGGVESMKARRIMERIRHFVRPIHVGGRNRRA